MSRIIISHREYCMQKLSYVWNSFQCHLPFLFQYLLYHLLQFRLLDNLLKFCQVAISVTNIYFKYIYKKFYSLKNVFDFFLSTDYLYLYCAIDCFKAVFTVIKKKSIMRTKFKIKFCCKAALKRNKLYSVEISSLFISV